MKYEKDTELIERVDYIIKMITDNEYYYIKYNKNFIICKLKAIIFFYKNFFFESERKEIKKIKKKIKEGKNDKK